MPVLILVNQSSVPINRDGTPSCQLKAGQEFQVMIERRAGYQAAFVKVVQPDAMGMPAVAGIPATKPKVHRVVMDPTRTHIMCPATWIASAANGIAAEVQVAWQPERDVRSRYVHKENKGDHVCSLECECQPSNIMKSNPADLPIQCYPPFPGMPNSHGGARDMNQGWIERWRSLPLTPELLAAKQAMKARIDAMREEYDVRPADLETVQIRVTA